MTVGRELQIEGLAAAGCPLRRAMIEEGPAI